MPSSETLERYEYKYLVRPEMLPGLRRAVEIYCAPDSHMASEGGDFYTIVSLYFDSPGLATYAAKRDRHLDRFKLRARSYGPRGDGPVFLEVKRKVNDRMLKYRHRALPGSWPQHFSPEGDAADPGSPALERFLYLVDRLGARPSALIRYRRAAFASLVDGYARVTFDQRIECQGPRAFSLDGLEGAWRGLDTPPNQQLGRSCSLIELKFTYTRPLWMVNLIRRFELFRIGFSKYCTGIDALHGADAQGQEATRTPARLLGGGPFGGILSPGRSHA